MWGVSTVINTKHSLYRISVAGKLMYEYNDEYI
jgi:hypothetical protein